MSDKGISTKEQILSELDRDLANVAEEYMYFYGVTRAEFANQARKVANEFTFGDDRDDEPTVSQFCSVLGGPCDIESQEESADHSGAKCPVNSRLCYRLRGEE